VSAAVPSATEVESAARKLADALLDTFAQGGPEALNAARLRWKEMADQLPTLAQQRVAKLTLRRALEHITNP